MLLGINILTISCFFFHFGCTVYGSTAILISTVSAVENTLCSLKYCDSTDSNVISELFLSCINNLNNHKIIYNTIIIM